MPEFRKYPLKLAPFFSERPWGGRRLETELGKTLPPGLNIGESWELSDHPDGRSRIANGPYEGRAFGDLIQAHPRGMCATPRAPERFPLLVKFIDAREDLSIQVHPDDARAQAFGDRGKTECWFVMGCSQDAFVIHGVREGVGAEDLRNAIGEGRVERLLRRLPIRRGSFVTVPAGAIHAIMGGTLLCEIQQSSNLTFRLWDWNRTPRRELHIENALSVANLAGHRSVSAAGAAEPPGGALAPDCRDTADLTGETQLVSNAYFSVKLLALAPRHEFHWKFKNPHGVIANVIEGGAEWSADGAERRLDQGAYGLGETWYVPPNIEAIRIRPGASGLRILVSRSLEFDEDE